MHLPDRKRFNEPFRWLTIAAGAGVCLYSALLFDVSRLDASLLFLAALTVAVAPRLSVPMPRVNGHITVSDTFIFLVLLIYGSEAAVLLAAAEGACSSVKMSRKNVTHLFNAAATAVPTFLTACFLHYQFGPVTELTRLPLSQLVAPVCLMGLLQYVCHSGLAAAAQAFKVGEPVWATWKKYCLWTSISYFVGAAAAGAGAKYVNAANFYNVLLTVPVIAIIYWTYRTYLRNIEVTAAAAKAEAEAGARAEAALAQAEQARRHIEELSHHIAEQERISRALEESREHFRYAAYHDALTGLPNRSLITECLKLSIERARQDSGYLFAVLFLDLDRFKVINDSLGHVFGDQLLVGIARRLEETVGHKDVAARLGGDEYVILLDGIKDLGEAASVAERIQESLSRPFDLHGHEAFTTASIGIALSCTGYEEPEDVLRDADIAMYRAKESGKARHEVFDKSMYTRALTLMQLESDMRRAIERGEFRVHFQPIVSLESGAVTGFEALVRWQHPSRGMVKPDEFIPLAEETGLIVPLGAWVLRQSCRQMREWQLASPASRHLTLSVNLSGKQFAQEDLVEQVEAILRDTNFEPRCLSLEITESVLMENAESANHVLRRLRAIGVRFSLDDFGTGYSSLSYLHRYPVNTLKIDRSFVSRMEEGAENSEIVRTVVTLAHNLGMNVVAEGVEKDFQAVLLKEMGCEYVQGYLFARALDADKAAALLSRRAEWDIPCAPGDLVTEHADVVSFLTA